MPTRRCYTCKETKEYSDFPKNRSQKLGIGNECRKCAAARSRWYRAQYPEKIKEHDHKRYKGVRKEQKNETNVRAKFGTALGTYAKAFAAQDGKCAVCLTTKAGGRWNGRFHMDHSAKTKRFRGLLCSDCNRGIGQLHDDPERLRRAAAYIERTT